MSVVAMDKTANYSSATRKGSVTVMSTVRAELENQQDVINTARMSLIKQGMQNMALNNIGGIYPLDSEMCCIENVDQAVYGFGVDVAFMERI